MTTDNERMLKLIEIGVDHPHSVMYRQSIAHHPGIELVGAVDADPDRAAVTLQNEGTPIPVARNLDDLPRGVQADAVLITLPNDRTAPAITEAAERGLHVFVEKPGARTAAEFAPAAEALEQRNLIFAMGYLRRVSVIAAELRSIVAQGVIGELVSAQITFSTLNVAHRNAAYMRGSRPELLLTGEDSGNNDAPTSDRHWLFDRERSGGGIMHWLGVHWIDLLRFVSDDEVAHVTASYATRSELPIDVEDTASTILEFSRGMQASLSCAYVLDRGPDQLGIAFRGTRGWMTWPGSGPEITVFGSHPAWRQSPMRTFRYESDPIPGYSGALGYTMLDRFRSAVLSGEPLPMIPLDAIRVLEVLDAAQQSAREHRRVEIASGL